MQCNLKKAKILFIFSWVNDDGLSFENDQLLSLISKGVKDAYPSLRIILILNSKYRNLVENDSLFEGIEVEFGKIPILRLSLLLN